MSVALNSLSPALGSTKSPAGALRVQHADAPDVLADLLTDFGSLPRPAHPATLDLAFNGYGRRFDLELELMTGLVADDYKVDAGAASSLARLILRPEDSLSVVVLSDWLVRPRFRAAFSAEMFVLMLSATVVDLLGEIYHQNTSRKCWYQEEKIQGYPRAIITAVLAVY